MITTIIFDLGAVLIDWNPRYLYRKIFETDNQTEQFLANVCTFDWNEEQDGGRSISEANEMLIALFPAYETEIRAYYSRWEEMLGGPIDETVKIFGKLKESGRYKLYALTNWSAETFPVALRLYDFLNWFDGIVVSGIEKLKKPDVRFYNLLLERYKIDPANALFIDDNKRNVDAAAKVGIQTHHFTTAADLEKMLKSSGVSV